MDSERPVAPPPIGHRPPPSAKVFSCPKCGAPLTIRAQGVTKVVACGHCGSTIDAEDETHAILETQGSITHPKPFFPLGWKGKFKSDVFEVIGFMIRGEDVYEWREYLLYNPFKGFRWLVEYDGHWNFFQSIKGRPTRTGPGGVSYLGTSYKLFQSGTAKVLYVLGEFYWVVKRGDAVSTNDYIAPPYMLSSEQDAHETIWSLGEYVTPDYLKWAFRQVPGQQLTAPFPAQTGVAPDQTSAVGPLLESLKPWLWIFTGLLVALQIFFAATRQDRVVHETSGYVSEQKKPDEAAAATRFPITGRTGAVDVDVYADINNTWLSFDVVLVEADTGKRYEGGTEVGFYSGSDSDGYWSEGTRHGEILFSSIPAGTYYLTTDVKGEGAGQGRTYSLKVVRDRLHWGAFWLGMLLILAFPGAFWLWQLSFEYHRWQTSSHPWLQTSAGDD